MYSFGPFALDPASRRLTRNGEPVAIPDRHVDILLELLAHAGQIVSKDRLIEAAWKDVAVTDNSLEQAISCCGERSSSLESLGTSRRSPGGATGFTSPRFCPGFTFSEFHDVTGTRAKVRELPRWLWMDAPSVAREGFDAVMAGAPIHVTGRVNRSIAFFARHLPQWVVVAVGRRTARRYRKG